MAQKAAAEHDHSRRRSERLEARMSVEQKRLIERAAALEGRTLTDFVLSSAQDAALRAIERHDSIVLSVRDSEAFVTALLNPPEASPRLRETIRLYRQKAGV